MRNTAKLVMTCNSLPSNYDKSLGMQRRLLIVPFNVEFSARKGNIDPYIKEKMQEEAAGIWNECAKCFYEAKKRTTFLRVKTVVDEVDEYINSMYSPETWVDDQLTAGVLEVSSDPEDYAIIQDMYQDFKDEALTEGIPLGMIPTAQLFGKIVRKKVNRNRSIVKRTDKGVKRVILGIKWSRGGEAF